MTKNKLSAKRGLNLSFFNCLHISVEQIISNFTSSLLRKPFLKRNGFLHSYNFPE